MWNAPPSQYSNKDDQPISKAEWEELADDRVYVRVGATEMRGGREKETRIVVSTVWTGVNTGSKEIFETLVTRDQEDVDSRRYHTIDEARDGHNEMVGNYMMELPGPRLIRDIPAEET